MGTLLLLSSLVGFISFVVGMSLPAFSKWHPAVEWGFGLGISLAVISAVVSYPH